MTVPGATRPGTAADAIDGVVPHQVVRPESGEDLARTLAEAARAGQTLVLRGGGSKVEWGRVPTDIGLVVETAGLGRLVAHRHGDMTATVQAGVSLASFNRALAERGQMLPIDSAFDAATIGGIVATNDAGPLRHRFGTPRDLLIGITLALTDGRLVKAGGTVVKNVAGYDLGKLVSGSCGSLAAIVDATFKLLPLPQASATLVASYTDAGALARDVAAIQASQVELTAFDVRADDGAAPQLLMRVASSPAATATQVEAVTQLLSTSPQVLSGAPEQEIWAEQIASAWQGSGTVVRFSWLPASLPAVLSLVARAARPGCRPSVFAGRIVGSGLLRLDGEEAACAAAIQELRASADVGHVVVLRASRSLKSQIDVWGPPSSAISMARALTRMFDPMGILNAGRGPV